MIAAKKVNEPAFEGTECACGALICADCVGERRNPTLEWDESTFVDKLRRGEAIDDFHRAQAACQRAQEERIRKSCVCNGCGSKNSGYVRKVWEVDFVRDILMGTFEQIFSPEKLSGGRGWEEEIQRTRMVIVAPDG